ncbi:MAG: adenylyl cyclase [Betaproteobacteria bacterium]|nr:adenylyl cyclase [Betaproteobacteria bacterium]
MFNTIRLKILAVATALLAVFAATTGFSTYLNRQVVEEMQAITEYHIPVGSHVASIEVLTMEIETQFRRALAKAPLDEKQVAGLRRAHARIVTTIRDDIKRVNSTLEAGIADVRNDVQDRLVMAELKGTFTFLDQRLAPLLQLGDDTLAAIEAGDLPRARSLAVGFGPFEDLFGKDIEDARRALDKLTLWSMTETENNQQKLLRLNAALFTLAAVFGLVLFVALTNRLHRSLGELLAGTRRVEGGYLDVSLPVNSSDEIGQLTHSFNQMVGQLKEKERVKDTFGKYLDPRIVARLIETQGDKADVSERRPATVFFSDIKGFSGMSESLTASAMVNLLNSYFSAVTREIRDQHGVIDKFIGDAVMAFWTAPFSTGDEYAKDACLAALAQTKAIAAFRNELPQITGLRRDAPDFAVRMGLATGEVVIGTIGSDITKSYTVIGDVVNTASRLEGVNKVYGTGIIIDEATHRYARSAVETRELDLLTVAGKTEPLKIYELLCAQGELTAEMAELRELFAAGLTAYRAHDWATAERRFSECLDRKADDGPALVFRQRIELLRSAPPPDDWDGVWRLSKK